MFYSVFDASMLTSTEKRNYRNFVKYIKGLGYVAVQESVYVRYTCKRLGFSDERRRIGQNTPYSIQVRLMCLPISYFDNMYNVNCGKIDFMLRTSIICM